MVAQTGIMMVAAELPRQATVLVLSQQPQGEAD